MRSVVREQKIEMEKRSLRLLRPEERLRLTLELSDFSLALREAGTREQNCQDI
ncbi:MAG: hypothetical protein ACRD1R_01860 [Acidobacteriota bacterium]